MQLNLLSMPRTLLTTLPSCSGYSLKKQKHRWQRKLESSRTSASKKVHEHGSNDNTTSFKRA